jgi:predicted membrane chloride channel (bestrophin family)
MNINHTRDLVRMANAYYDGRGVSPEQRADDLNHVALCTWAFVRCMKRHLSPEEEDEIAFQQELYEKLPQQQAEMIITAAHRPNRALQDLSYAIDDLPMHFLRKNEIHRAVTIFEDNLGSSERILTSPVPLFYSRHLARFLAVWLLLLPFGIYDAFSSSWNHLAMIPATAIISIMLFGIEEIGTQLEEPFTLLPMQAFCDKVRFSKSPLMHVRARSFLFATGFVFSHIPRLPSFTFSFRSLLLTDLQLVHGNCVVDTR